jgi:hypothetical protein
MALSVGSTAAADNLLSVVQSECDLLALLHHVGSDGPKKELRCST